MTDLIPHSLGFDISILAGSVASSSMKMYERDLRAYLEYAHTPEAARDAATLARWRTELVNTTLMSPNTINRMLSAVKRLMAQACEQKYITAEEAEAFKRVRGVKVDTLKERMRISNRVRISPEAMRALIDSIDTSTLVGLRNKALFLTMASSGLRVQELAKLTLPQIFQKDGKYLLHMYAEHGKNQKQDREAHISLEAVAAITVWLAARPVESQYIFTSFSGRNKDAPGYVLTKHITPQGAWQVVKQIAEPFVADVKPHDFRRFVGTQLIKTKGLTHAQRALGHQSSATTTKYDLSEIEPGATDDLF